MPGQFFHPPKPQEGYVPSSCSCGRTEECRSAFHIRRCRTVLLHRKSVHARRPLEGSGSPRRHSVEAMGADTTCRRDTRNTTASAEYRSRRNIYEAFPVRAASCPGDFLPKAFNLPPSRAVGEAPGPAKRPGHEGRPGLRLSIGFVVFAADRFSATQNPRYWRKTFGTLALYQHQVLLCSLIMAVWHRELTCVVKPFLMTVPGAARSPPWRLRPLRRR